MKKTGFQSLLVLPLLAVALQGCLETALDDLRRLGAERVYPRR